jgi:hypothetical protein
MELHLWKHERLSPQTSWEAGQDHKSLEALYAVLFSKSFGFLEVVFEGDASQVISDINSPPPHFSKAGQFTESVLSKSKSLRFVSFVHAPRELNVVAHVLAKTAIGRKLNFCWREEVPDCISNLILREKEFHP